MQTDTALAPPDPGCAFLENDAITAESITIEAAPSASSAPASSAPATPEPARGLYERAGRRALDLAFLAVALPFAALLAVPIALWNLCVFRDPRRVFFLQERVGRGGRRFCIYKFRTMRDPRESAIVSWSSGADALRTTRFGRFLRNTHLDELPQLLNILFGDMHLVGPRPEMVEVHAWACEVVPGFERRLASAPGLTGLAQITQGYTGRSQECYARKLAIDLEYLAAPSLLADLRVILRTVPWVLQGRGWSWNKEAKAREAVSPPRRTLVARMDERWFPGAGKNWDDELFRSRVLAVLRESDDLLDLGAGAGIVAAMDFRGRARHVAGVDLDARVLANPFLDEGRVGDGASIPWPDESFDVVVADNVLEHLADPVAVFREVARVLRPGGRFLVKTPNALHYVAVIARCTPTAFHRAVNRRRGRSGEDTFPTLYRANTPGRLARAAREAGLSVARTELVEGRPEYLRFNAVTYALGIAYARIVAATPWLSRFRVLLIGELVKGAPRANEAASARHAAHQEPAEVRAVRSQRVA